MAKIIITIILMDIVITVTKDDYSLIWEQALIELLHDKFALKNKKNANK